MTTNVASQFSADIEAFIAGSVQGMQLVTRAHQERVEATVTLRGAATRRSDTGRVE